MKIKWKKAPEGLTWRQFCVNQGYRDPSEYSLLELPYGLFVEISKGKGVWWRLNDSLQPLLAPQHQQYLQGRDELGNQD